MKRLYLSILLLYVYVGCISQTLSVGLLVRNKASVSNQETTAAYEFLTKNEKFKPSVIDFSDLSAGMDLGNFDVIWYHKADSVELSYDKSMLDAINGYLQNGGNLLLTLDAFHLLNDLNIEPVKAESRYKVSKDEGYGRKLGLHAYRSHPLFNGLNGGAYIFRAHQDTVVRITGYFDQNVPRNGAVVAVDWDYIFLRENTKLVTEYIVNPGKGKVIAIGAYTYLAGPNYNREHLEKFLTNALNYLSLNQNEQPAFYWKYYPQQVFRFESFDQKEVTAHQQQWNYKPSDLAIRRKEATPDFWDAAGERMLIMGNQKGGIDEIWSHPFMAFRDYKAGIRFMKNDSINWLNNSIPEIEITPASFNRIYRFGSSILKETVVAMKQRASGIIHYEYEGDEPVQLFVKFKTNMRLMWPYSENVNKEIRFAYDDHLNAMLFKDDSGDFGCLIGADKTPLYHQAGQFDNFTIFLINDQQEALIQSSETDTFEAGGIFQFEIKPGEPLDLVVAASNTGIDSAIADYYQTISDTKKAYDETVAMCSQLLNNSLQIITPDTAFNKGYNWALEATDRFFVNTPGLGKSLVAGYSTTNTGWDGGQKVSGRPGYAWYFGRDGEWSGFALLDYGDFEKVKSELEMYQKYQDLSGKIYHEVSTSGVVHYDAADATPLYIILAGKYLKHSGDLEFIKASWPFIQKALDFCFSTDTDGDHLIENTNVGHGWVEGGSLFGSHTSLYLASCWAEALNEASYMAQSIDLTDAGNDYKKEAEIVNTIINTDFWNPDENFYYHGKFSDQSYMDQRSIMPAIPIYFQQADREKAAAVLPVLAENIFSSDWGCRIIGEDNPHFNPNGYHTGSIWPLFTGWAALAEYTGGRSVQGFTHLMDNLQVYKYWGLGFVEEVLNGEVYKPSGVCRHQCWSETMVLQPAIEGLLGIETDAVANMITLSPQLPADWNTFEAKNIRMGDHLISIKMNRKKNNVTWQIDHKGPAPVKLIFNPVFPEGTTINKITSGIQSDVTDFSPEKPMIFDLGDSETIRYDIKGGIKVLSMVYDPKPGDKSTGARIISDRLENNIYTISLEALQGKVVNIDFYVVDYKIKKIVNGKIIGRNGNVFKIEVNFDEPGEGYLKKEVKIYL